VADNLRTATGLAVRINPDVYTAPTLASSAMGSAATSALSPAAAAPAAATTANGLPAPSVNAGLATANPAVRAGVAAPASAVTAQLPLSFSGDLSDYLDQVASAAGINWEFNGEIHFHRLTTRVF
jgi:hypothetical protein